MTVALVLAGNLGEDDAGQQQQMLCGQLAALGVRRVDAAERTGPGLLTVAAAARVAGERVLICAGAEQPAQHLLGAGGTAAFTESQAGGALVVDTPDLDALAQSAESLAATHVGPTAVGGL